MSDTKITRDQFQHIAKLSRLPIKPEENFIADQLTEAAAYVEVLNKLNIGNIKPTSQVNHKKNVFRDDIVGKSFSQTEALSQAARTHQGFFLTKATIKKK